MTNEPKERLAQAVRLRRRLMRLKQTELKDLGGPSHTTVGAIERGDWEALQDGTKASIEQALGWVDGSVDQVLAGGDPVEQVAPDVVGSRGQDGPSAADLESRFNSWLRRASLWPPGVDKSDPEAIEGAIRDLTRDLGDTETAVLQTENELEHGRLLLARYRSRVQEIDDTLRNLAVRLNEIRTSSNVNGPGSTEPAPSDELGAEEYPPLRSAAAERRAMDDKGRSDTQ